MDKMMSLTKRIVTEIPLKELWINGAQIEANRTSYLTRLEITDVLKSQPISFVVANIGEPLEWIEPSNCYQFWKNEVKEHVAGNLNHINLDDFPSNYAFIASKWTTRNHEKIILLEKVH